MKLPIKSLYEDKPSYPVYDRFVGYGKNKLEDPAVKAYAYKAYISHGRNAYKASDDIDRMLPRTASKEKRQFLNCVADSLQRWFD